ncbi:MAG: hypothetical protein AAF657_23765 [Acidobacteriota bacterium]
MTRGKLYPCLRCGASRAFPLMVCALLGFVVAGAASGQGGTIFQAEEDFELFCALTVDPQPTGTTDRPDEDFEHPEYFYLHSATHLQGEPSTEKHAPGLFWEPAGTLFYDDFRSLVVVNNLSPTQQAAVNIQFFDLQGTPLPATAALVPAEGSINVSAIALQHSSSATPGLGSALITSDIPVVGGTLHHAYGLLGGAICDPDPMTPGATSMQQLQVRQDNKTKVQLGPVPVTNQAPAANAFLNGVLPTVWVRNPTSQPNTVDITYTSNTGFVLGPFTYNLAPNGAVLDTSNFNNLASQIYTGSGAFNAYYLVEAVSTSGLPLVGEVLLTNFFGPDADGQDDPDGPFLDVGARFRMGSAMMANTNRKVLVSPEFTYQTGNPGVTTLLGIWNTSSVDVGPVTIRYFDRDGVTLSTDTLTTMAPGKPAVIGPGMAASPNYPAPGVFDGWVRITACKKGLIGWTMRQTEGSEFQKVFGETLHGTNAKEPGNGSAVTVAGTNLTRKVKPISQVTDSFVPWPGYEAIVNDSIGNIGNYYYRFHGFFSGADVTDYTQQPFLGLRFANTSLTYEDNFVTSPGITLVSGRVDHTAGVVKGIGTLGAPLEDWLFQDPYFVPAPTCSP